VKQLSTFKFETHPSKMSDDELQEMAELIVDKWAEDLAVPDSAHIDA
jgi:hypothetical protein